MSVKKTILKRRLAVLLSFVFSMLMAGCCHCSVESDEMAESIYRKGLSDLLVRNLTLDDYDRQLAESEEKFIPVDEETKSGAQRNDMMGLQYIYMRNELYLDRLSQEERRLLCEQADGRGDDMVLSERAMALIETTWPFVIAAKEIKSEEDRKVMTYYDSRLHQDFVSVDTLVLKIGTQPEYDENGNYIDEDHEFEKHKTLIDYAARMEKELQEKLGEVPIRVLVD